MNAVFAAEKALPMALVIAMVMCSMNVVSVAEMALPKVRAIAKETDLQPGTTVTALA
jgi:cell division protein FtsL